MAREEFLDNIMEENIKKFMENELFELSDNEVANGFVTKEGQQARIYELKRLAAYLRIDFSTLQTRSDYRVSLQSMVR